MMSYLLNGAGSAIKPSVSFVSMSRRDYKQHIYTDEYDGPSSLQIIGNEQSQKDKAGGADNLYEVERNVHSNEIPVKTHVLDDVKKMLYTNYAEPGADTKTLLSMPAAKRAEIKIAKDKLEEFAHFKEKHKFLGRRERVIKSGWRHGVTGLDNADSENTSYFYRETKDKNDFTQSEKDKLNNSRLQSKLPNKILFLFTIILFIYYLELKITFGTSSQTPVGTDTYKRTRSLLQTKPERSIDIHETWKRRNIVKGSQAELDTRKRIYEPASNIEREPEDGCMKKILIERSLKLRREDLRSKTFNIQTNNQEQENNWLNSFGDQKD